MLKYLIKNIFKYINLIFVRRNCLNCMSSIYNKDKNCYECCCGATLKYICGIRDERIVNAISDPYNYVCKSHMFDLDKIQSKKHELVVGE